MAICPIETEHPQPPASKPAIMALAVILIAGLGLADYFSDPYLSLLIFYLIPIFLTVWYAGRWQGFLMVVVSTLVWFIHNLALSGSFMHPIIPYWDITLKIIFCIVFVQLTYRLKTALEREKQFSRIDYLTEMANRRGFFDSAAIEISRYQRYKRPFTVAYMDIDNFKMINDRFGHETGDKLLMLVAKTIKNSIRLVDVAARMGGDEFVILFPETTYDAAQFVVQRLRKNLLETMHGQNWPVTFSIGMVTCISQTCTLDTIMSAADELMYDAKKAGTNMVKHRIMP